MPTLSSCQIPPPANWQDFETLCCDLWRRIWKDPNTLKNGRQGYPQHGVDVYGRPEEGDKWGGVQCKGKDNFADKVLTEREVKTEVKKAKSFRPRLSEFIIATTGQKEVSLQELARKITNEHRKKGLFSVHVWAWSDMVSRMEEFPEVIEKHYPGLGQNTKALKEGIDEIKRAQQASLNNGTDIKALLSLSLQHMETSGKHEYREISEAILTPEYQAELDHSRDLVNRSRPVEALLFLDKLKERIWLTAPSVVKYRLLTFMAGAKLAMNEEQQAARLFIEAQQYYPEHENALCNAGLGYVLLGQMDDARECVNKVLEKDPANARASSIIVQASAKEETLDEIISKVPEFHRNSRECAFAIADQARRKGKLEEAKKWLEIAIENDTDDLPELKAGLGEVLLSIVLQHPRVANAHVINDSEKETIEEAVHLLTEAWEAVCKTDRKNFNLGWVVNRGIAKGLLDDHAGAVRDVETALEVEASNPIFIRYRAMLAREGKDNKKAEALLKEIVNAPETPDASLLLGEVLLEEGRPNEAIRILNEFLKGNPSTPLREEANRLLIHAYVNCRNFEEAKKISDSSRALGPTSILNLTNAARIARVTGESRDAIALLKEATKYLSESSTFRELYELGNELYSLEHYEDAAAIYERVADKSIDGPLTRRLLNSYYGSGERAKALEICQTLRKKYGPSRYISEMESAIYEEIGDVAKAQEICKEYLGLFPDDFEMKLRLAVVNFRSGKFEELDDFLKSSMDVNAISLEAGVQIAYLCEARGLGQRSVVTMYEIRRRFFEKADAHIKYIGFMFQKQKDADRLLKIDKISVDTAVCVEDTTHHREWYIIEDRQDADMSRGEIKLEHPLAQKLLGKTIKEEVILKQSEFGTEIGKIVAIKSKYVHGLHESLSSFSKLFPSHAGLMQVKVGPPEKRGEPPSGFEPVLEHVSRQHELDLEVKHLYKGGVLTIGAFAKLVRRNVLEVWGSVTAKPNLGLRCCIGSVDERNQAISLLAERQRLVVDVISLMTLHGIDAEDMIVKAFGKLGIAQSTIDFLGETINERKGIWSKGFLTIGKEGEQFVKQEVSSEDVGRNIQYLERILEWVRHNCEIIACRAALDMKAEYKQQLDELIGSIFVDTVLVAGEPGNLLYSDDERLRSFAKGEFNVEGVWTQVALMDCLRSRMLQREQYNKMVVKLGSSNYYHTSIDADILIEAARQSNWAASPPYTQVVRVLSGERSDEQSAVAVGTNFLYELWKRPILAQQRDYLILSLFDAITSERKPGDILDKLTVHVKKRFLLIPLAERQVIDMVGVWRKIHIS